MDSGEYLIEKITVDNIPELGDELGIKYLNRLEHAISECKKFTDDGYRL